MFRALSCSSSGRQIVLLQHLVSSLSVNVSTVRRLRADSAKSLAQNIQIFRLHCIKLGHPSDKAPGIFYICLYTLIINSKFRGPSFKRPHVTTLPSLLSSYQQLLLECYAMNSGRFVPTFRKIAWPTSVIT